MIRIPQGYGSRVEIEAERARAFRMVTLGRFSAMDTYNELTEILANLDGHEMDWGEEDGG